MKGPAATFGWRISRAILGSERKPKPPLTRADTNFRCVGPRFLRRLSYCSALSGSLEPKIRQLRQGGIHVDDAGETATTTGGISRRKLIAGGVAAGGAVWVAPMITSSTAAAAASGAPLQACAATGCQPGNPNPIPCGSGGCTSGSCTGNIGCFSLVDTEGNCFCGQGLSFSDCSPTCTTSADCPGGAHCVTGLGFEPTVGMCVDCCGNNCH